MDVTGGCGATLTDTKVWHARRAVVVVGPLFPFFFIYALCPNRSCFLFPRAPGAGCDAGPVLGFEHNLWLVMGGSHAT